MGIARALAASPKILLADESTSALDPQTTQDVLRLLRKVNTELGITIVVITHELEVVRAIADRVAVLENGRVAEHGPVFDIFTRPQALIMAATLVATYAVSIVYNIRRYVTGISVEGADAHGGVDWWWSGLPGPAVVIGVGVLSWAALITVVLLELVLRA